MNFFRNIFLWILVSQLITFLNNVKLKVIKDATHGSESGKTISLYVLDALICIDHERYFLSQLQSRGFLRSCLTAISNISNQVFVLTLTNNSLYFEITFSFFESLLWIVCNVIDFSSRLIFYVSFGSDGTWNGNCRWRGMHASISLDFKV